MYCMRKLRSFGVNSDMLVTFYNAVIIMYYYYIWFCLLGWEYFKIRQREVGKDCKKKQVNVWESHWIVLRLYTKRDCTEN